NTHRRSHPTHPTQSTHTRSHTPDHRSHTPDHTHQITDHTHQITHTRSHTPDHTHQSTHTHKSTDTDTRAHTPDHTHQSTHTLEACDNRSMDYMAWVLSHLVNKQLSLPQRQTVDLLPQCNLFPFSF